MSHRSNGATWRAVGGGFVAAVLLMSAGCATTRRGVELGDLRTVARRVQGGGIECPISFAPSLIRPSTVPVDATILPLRVAGNGSVGVLGTDDPEVKLPDSGSVEIICHFKVDALRVDIVMLGVPKGHAIAGLLPTFRQFSGLSAAALAPFFAANAQLPVGEARAIPGAGRASYTRVEAATGDIGLVVGVSGLNPTVILPTAAEVTATSVKIAHHLAS